MTKKKSLICIIVVVLIALVVVPPTIYVVKKARMDKAVKQNMEDFYETAARLESTLEDMGWDMETTRQEILIPLTLADKDGHTIIFYNYHYMNMDKDDSPPAIHEIFDPAKADSSSICKVNDIDATLYRKGSDSYLWWSPSDGLILLISYETDFVADSEILKMAESVKPINTAGE